MDDPLVLVAQALVSPRLRPVTQTHRLRLHQLWVQTASFLKPVDRHLLGTLHLTSTSRRCVGEHEGRAAAARRGGIVVSVMGPVSLPWLRRRHLALAA